MWQPQSIRSHLAAVFLLFFALVLILGAFSIWRLSNFDALSADVAEIWLPTTRALGDLNNYTSDFRAFEGSALLSSDQAEAAANEKQMAELDRTIAEAERLSVRCLRQEIRAQLRGSNAAEQQALAVSRDAADAQLTKEALVCPSCGHPFETAANGGVSA